MKTLIIGATGTIGQQIKRLSEENGDIVVAASRKESPSIDIEDPKSMERYFGNASSVDAIICVAGNASFGKLAEMNEQQIKLGINSKLLGQVHLVKEGLKKLNPGGVIILTGGMLAYSPWPETSNIAMANAGLEGFVKAVALELQDNKRVLIVHPPLVRETAESMGMDSAPWPSARTVAESYISNLKGESNGTSIFVPGYSPN